MRAGPVAEHILHILQIPRRRAVCVSLFDKCVQILGRGDFMIRCPTFCVCRRLFDDVENDNASVPVPASGKRACRFPRFPVTSGRWSCGCAPHLAHSRTSRSLANLALLTRSTPVIGTSTTQMQQIKAVVFDVRIHLISTPHVFSFSLSNLTPL